MTEYSADGFKVVLTNCYDTLDAVSSYFEDVGLNQFVNYEGEPPVWPQYGYEGYTPHTVLIDCDGNIRKMNFGAIDTSPRCEAWEKAIAEMTGNTFP